MFCYIAIEQWLDEALHAPAAVPRADASADFEALLRRSNRQSFSARRAPPIQVSAAAAAAATAAAAAASTPNENDDDSASADNPEWGEEVLCQGSDDEQDMPTD